MSAVSSVATPGLDGDKSCRISERKTARLAVRFFTVVRHQCLEKNGAVAVSGRASGREHSTCEFGVCLDVLSSSSSSSFLLTLLSRSRRAWRRSFPRPCRAHRVHHPCRASRDLPACRGKCHSSRSRLVARKKGTTNAKVSAKRQRQESARGEGMRGDKPLAPLAP